MKELEYDEQVALANRPADPEAQSVHVTVEFKSDGDAPPLNGAAQMTKVISITPHQAETKGVKVGKQFRAYSMYQTSGTCNPGPYLAAFSEWK